MGELKETVWPHNMTKEQWDKWREFEFQKAAMQALLPLWLTGEVKDYTREFVCADAYITAKAMIAQGEKYDR